MGRAEVKPTFGSLFAGIGGFDLGMEKAGWECKFQVEWDKHCRAILDIHWEGLQKWGDVRNVNGRFLPPVDCIIFGSPCQDLSQAGKRAGLDGERSGLFHEAMRIIKEMRDATGGVFPKYSIWENVGGALTSNKGADFGRVIDEMAINGALVVEWAVLDAQWFSLPQRRKRVFTVAVYDPDAASRCSEQILPIAESVSRDIAKDRRKTSETSTKTDAGDIESGEWWDGGQVAGTLTTTSHLQLLPEKGKFQAVLQPVLVDIQRVGDIRVYSEPVQTLQARMGTGGNTTPMVACEPEMLLRRITPLECERLMGFPDDHTRWKSEGMTGNMKFRSEQADSHRYKQLGNSVAVPVAKWVGEQVMRVHRNAYPVTPLV